MSPTLRRALVAVCAIAAAGLSALLLWRILREPGGTNSYALAAQALLQGDPAVDRCFDSDCVQRGGKFTVVFPLLPAVIATPLVALNGVETSGFMLLGALCLVGALLLWWRLLRGEGLDTHTTGWVVTALAAGSPLAYVTLRNDGVWFTAQSVAFVLVSGALYAARTSRLTLAGALLGGAVLSRQLSIMYAPLLVLLAPSAGQVVRPRTGGSRVASVALPLLAALVCAATYNHWRFGSVLESGYGLLDFTREPLASRIRDHGLWDLAYVPFNAAYLFLQGFHVEFGGSGALVPQAMDPGGTAILAASPWLLLLLFAPLTRGAVLLWSVPVALAGAMLFYHSNGMTQHNTQRYVLDWLPAALLLLARALRDASSERVDWLRLLVTWSVVLNATTWVILAAAS